MAFEFKKCSIEGLYEIQPQMIGDSRGYFFEAYNEKAFFEAGLKMKFVQDNQSKSSKYVVRGLHFQKQHPQGKLIRVLDGEAYDVVVDLRSDSATFGNYCGLILSSEKNNMIYIPEGFAHGFCTLSDTAILEYKCSDFYHPEDEDGIFWNDSTLAINWEEICPGITENVKLSQKDKKNVPFNMKNKYFDCSGRWIDKLDMKSSIQ